MLEVSLDLVAVAAMLCGIYTAYGEIQVDGLNSPTARLTLTAWSRWGWPSSAARGRQELI